MRGEPYTGPLVKPTRLARQLDRFEKQKTRQAEKRQRELAEAAAWRVLSMQVCALDRQTCRVCGRLTQPYGVLKGDPRSWGGSHHIVYRSAGGPDAVSNLVWVCNACSEAEHSHRYAITGTGALISIIETNLETGRVVRAWESKR